MVTIYDIAKRVGCAPSTVSRALGGVNGVKEEKKKKILRVAEEMDYVPDSTAKNLKTKRSWNIGVIMYVEDMVGLKHYLFADILNNFASIVESENYDITLFSRNIVLSNKSLLAHCRSKRLDGVFIVCGDFTTEPVKELLDSGIPVVAVDYYNAEDNNVNCVTTDNRRKMFELTDYVIGRGHRNIVYITGRDIFVTQERIKGFLAAMKTHNIAVEGSSLVTADYYNLSLSYQRVKEVLNRENRPTAILMPDDYCALAAYDAIREKGLRIPEDISVAGFDGLEIGQIVYPPLTTVKQDTVRMGEYAAEKLLSLINGGVENGNKLHIIEGSIIGGGSVSGIAHKKGI